MTWKPNCVSMMSERPPTGSAKAASSNSLTIIPCENQPSEPPACFPEGQSLCAAASVAKSEPAATRSRIARILARAASLSSGDCDFGVTRMCCARTCASLPNSALCASKNASASSSVGSGTSAVTFATSLSTFRPRRISLRSCWRFWPCFSSRARSFAGPPASSAMRRTDSSTSSSVTGRSSAAASSKSSAVPTACSSARFFSSGSCARTCSSVMPCWT